MKKTKSKTGFTIIEVVLVLAIAGLIMLMVFIALPSMQRSQRDTERKNNYSLIITAITNYTSAHRGALPTAASDLAPYLDNELTDPDSDETYVTDGVIAIITPAAGATATTVNNYRSSTTTPLTADQPLAIIKGTDCDGQELGSRRYALVGKLEAGEPYCQAN